MNSSIPGSLGFTVRQISDDMEQLMRPELMMDHKIPPSFAETILSFPDKYNERDPGFFFGSHGEASSLLRCWAEHFAVHLSRCRKPIIQRDNTVGPVHWRPSEHAPSWLQAVDKLSAILYVLVHICGGGPPRVTEMIESKLRNTAGSRRNLFIIDKCLAVVGVYSKTSEEFEKPKPIARFLDERTTELLLIFVVYIKTTQAFLLRKSMAEIDANNGYLFCQGGRKFEEKAIYREFSRALSSRGVPFNVRMYRHYRTGIAKPSQSSSFEELVFWQAGHSEVTAHMRYAGGDFSFEDLIMPKLDGFHVVSRRWHELLGLTKSNRRYHGSVAVLQAPLKRKLMPYTNYTPAAVTLAQNITGKEAAEKEIEGIMCAASTSGMGSREIAASISNRSSLENLEEEAGHLFSSKPDTAKRSRTTFFSTANPNHSSDFLKGTVMNSVRNILGQGGIANVKFKSAAQRSTVFESTLHTVLTENQNSMLVVLPTGGGTTLCWAAPALREQHMWDSSSMKPPITFVIVPLIALQQDLLRKCANYGIRCVDWNNRFKDGTTMVVFSIDAVFTNDYDRYVTAQFSQGRLARTVIDEIHLLLQWKTFRRFGLIGPRLRPGGTQELPLLLMSATVTSGMISDLQELLALDMCCLKMFRALNTRTNVCYKVIYVDFVRMEDMIERCASVIHKERSSVAPRDRVIACCLTVKECKLLHDALSKMKSKYKTCIYYGSMSREDRKENFDAWINAESDVLVVMSSTSAFSCGIDYDHVREVVHVGGSRSIVELAQESG